jgi:hypothetical protein
MPFSLTERHYRFGGHFFIRSIRSRLLPPRLSALPLPGPGNKITQIQKLPARQE